MEADATSQMFLSGVSVGQRDRYLALVVVLVSLTAFVVLAPFAKTPLGRVWGFIPCYESMLVVCDLVTVLLLLGQATAAHSRTLLVLACAYLYSAAMTVIHLLTFPGVFSSDGWLGAGPQSTAWLYNFWHGGFPLLVMAYARRPQATFSESDSNRSVVLQFLAWGAGTLALVGALAALATVGHSLLPTVIDDGQYTPAMPLVVASTWLLSMAALVVTWRQHRRSVLDLWLAVVMLASLIDVALSALLNAARFDLGFYAGRIYGLLAASFVLMVLLIQNGMLHSRLSAMTRELQRLSGLDALTGIANRRSFDSALEAEWRRAIRNGTPLSLLMIDIDHFKNYNDAYGHVQGDVCLRTVATTLAAGARRAGELCARYGGEEFAMLLPLTAPDEAAARGRELCAAIEASAMAHANSPVADHVTVSIGVACLRASRSDTQYLLQPRQLVELADRALYQTKSSGRNGVSVGGELWLGGNVVAA